MNNWIKVGMVKQQDTHHVAQMSDVEDDESDFEMDDRWDTIDTLD